MKRDSTYLEPARILRGFAAAAAAIALLLAFFSTSSTPPPENRVEQPQEWPDLFALMASEQASELTRLEHSIELEAKPVARPVPQDSGLFEVTPALRPRVDFWIRVYTDISSYQAILHDSWDLERVYGLIDLRDEPGVSGNDFDSMRSAALRVLKRYREHIRYLTLSNYDPAKLEGERRRLYDLMRRGGGVAKFKGADATIRVQRGLRDTVRNSIIRSGRYMERYIEIFRERNLPEELALLPHIESSFTFQARSSAGAVGIWQLTSAAARPHLHISRAIDERIDPWRSAEVASLLLADNYRQLKDWPLAITAYNQGAGSMKRAIRATGSRNIEVIIDRYRGRSYGFAGRNFYAGFLAVLEVMRHYEIHFGPLPVEPPIELRRHRVRKTASLAAVCRELGIEPGDIEYLNPALTIAGYGASLSLPRGVVLNLPPADDGDS